MAAFAICDHSVADNLLSRYSRGRGDFFFHIQNVFPEPNTGCWFWMGAIRAGGYGQTEYKGQQTLAHRAALSAALGRDIPRGIVVRHRCDTPCCVNPDHLVLGTQADNVADMMKRGRHRGLRGGTYMRRPEKLTDDQVRSIRGVSGLSQQAIADQYGVSRELVRDIRLRRARSKVV